MGKLFCGKKREIDEVGGKPVVNPTDPKISKPTIEDVTYALQGAINRAAKNNKPIVGKSNWSDWIAELTVIRTIIGVLPNREINYRYQIEMLLKPNVTEEECTELLRILSRHEDSIGAAYAEGGRKISLKTDRFEFNNLLFFMKKTIELALPNAMNIEGDKSPHVSDKESDDSDDEDNNNQMKLT